MIIRKSTPYYLFLKIIFFLLLLIFVDILIGAVVKSLIQSGRIDTMSNIEYALRTSPEILIVGASSAELGYNTRFIEHKTGLRALNIATGSVSSTYVYIVLRKIFQEHKPKIIIYDAPESDLMGITSNDALDKLSYLYGEDNDLDKLFEQAISGAVLLNSNIYKYRKQIKNLLRPKQTLFSDNFKYVEPDGAKGLDYDVSKKLITTNEEAVRDYYQMLNEQSITYKAFWRIVELCESNEVSLHIVVGPKFPWLGIYPQNELVAETQEKLSGYRFVRLLYVSPELYPEFSQKQYYKDVVHVNGPGADLLSGIISEEIQKSYILTQPHR